MSNFGLGSSFATDDMMTGRVDLRLGFEPPTVMHEPQAFVPAAIALCKFLVQVRTLLSLRSFRSHTSFSVLKT